MSYFCLFNVAFFSTCLGGIVDYCLVSMVFFNSFLAQLQVYILHVLCLYSLFMPYITKSCRYIIIEAHGHTPVIVAGSPS